MLCYTSSINHVVYTSPATVSRRCAQVLHVVAIQNSIRFKRKSKDSNRPVPTKIAICHDSGHIKSTLQTYDESDIMQTVTPNTRIYDIRNERP